MSSRTHDTREPEHIETVVVGAGQAGLSVGYHLKRHGLPFAILDANERVGDSWRAVGLAPPVHARPPQRARRVALPGRPALVSEQGRDGRLPGGLCDAVRAAGPDGVRVDTLARNGSGFVLTAGDLRFEADNVVVAMSNWQNPRRPAFADELDPAIVQLHSGDYRNPSQLRDGGTLVVGAGNSGAEIALELARHQSTWLSGRHPGHVPFRIEGLAARYVLADLVLRGAFHRVLTVRTPVGRKVRSKVLSHGMPLVRTKPKDLAATGVERVPRTVGVRDGLPLLENDRVLEVANVVWCTGFDPDYSWIDLPVLEEHGPRHERGIVHDEPGLFFVGLAFLYAASSSMLHGVGRDAERIAAAIASRAG